MVNGDGFAVGQDRAFRTLSAGRKPFLKVTGVPKRCRRSAFTIRLRSRVSGTGVKLRSVRVTLNGRKLKTVTKAGRFRVKINARKLKAGQEVHAPGQGDRQQGPRHGLQEGVQALQGQEALEEEAVAGPVLAALYPVAEAACAASFHESTS